MKYSLVIPLHNEAENVEALIEQVTSTMHSLTDDYEIICVDDGSTDSSLMQLISLQEVNHQLKILKLSRCFGHQAAYTAGLTYAKGDLIITLDGDLQDPPSVIIEMNKMMEEEHLDVVYGKRIARKEGFIKRIMILIFHKLHHNLSNINAPKNVGNFAMMNKKVLKAFLTLEERNRYLPGLRFFVGFKQGYVEYIRPDREAGTAKMNLSRLTQLAFDAIFSFSNWPIKVSWILGLIGIILSIVGMGIVLYKNFIGDAITGWTSTMLTMFFLGSVQLLFLGVIGEYVYRTYNEVQKRPLFIVDKYYD